MAGNVLPPPPFLWSHWPCCCARSCPCATGCMADLRSWHPLFEAPGFQGGTARDAGHIGRPVRVIAGRDHVHAGAAGVCNRPLNERLPARSWRRWLHCIGGRVAGARAQRVCARRFRNNVCDRSGCHAALAHTGARCDLGRGVGLAGAADQFPVTAIRLRSVDGFQPDAAQLAPACDRKRYRP